MAHHFVAQLRRAGPSMLPRKKTRILREVKEMPARLPLHADGSIAVRVDSARMDAMKALIVGAAGTPYANGLFAFDVYFPSDYPDCPMQVHNCTTGDGTVELNSNLYSNGKVCLSLLGTAGSSGEESARWNPETTSLVQVLMSIQAMVLVEEPLSNHPGFEGLKGTAAFKHQSAAFNQELQLHTVRLAMVALLRSPPIGFEEVVEAHFLHKREAVRSQCLQWLRSASADVRAPLGSAVQQLFELLDRLG